jgi:hypothetical protein
MHIKVVMGKGGTTVPAPSTERGVASSLDCLRHTRTSEKFRSHADRAGWNFSWKKKKLNNVLPVKIIYDQAWSGSKSVVSFLVGAHTKISTRFFLDGNRTAILVCSKFMLTL